MPEFDGMGFREALAAAEDDIQRAGMIEAEYVSLVRDEKKSPKEAAKLLMREARGRLPSQNVNRAISRGVSLSKNPDGEKRFRIEASTKRHRSELEEAIRRRHTLEPVTFGIDGIDESIPGGITAGEILHIVGGEGGLKTSLLLHILCRYTEKGGRALFFSLDMTPEMIELRLLMRVMNRGKTQAMEHIQDDTDEYQRARAIREEQDTKLCVMGGPLDLDKMGEAILMSGADVAAIDYVTLVEGYNNELETAREVTKAVRRWRKAWGVTFILLSQMSRESKRDAAQGGNGGHGIGGSSLEQLADYEVELMRDEPLILRGKPRLIATLRKNRSGPCGVSYEIFPCFPSLTFMKHAERVERERKGKPMFQAFLGCGV
jgi:KaiC/GvpD/RAD55 family RecA-like ATPase